MDGFEEGRIDVNLIVDPVVSPLRFHDPQSHQVAKLPLRAPKSKARPKHDLPLIERLPPKSMKKPKDPYP